MATSPGGRGGSGNLENMIKVFPYQGASEISSFSLPSFFDNFSEGVISNEELDLKLKELVVNFI